MGGRACWPVGCGGLGGKACWACCCTEGAGASANASCRRCFWRSRRALVRLFFGGVSCSLPVPVVDAAKTCDADGPLPEAPPGSGIKNNMTSVAVGKESKSSTIGKVPSGRFFRDSDFSAMKVQAARAARRICMVSTCLYSTGGVCCRCLKSSACQRSEAAKVAASHKSSARDLRARAWDRLRASGR